MTSLFQAIFYRPLFNALILLLPVVGGDFGLAVILFTIIIRVVLYPLAQKSIRAQREMQSIQPEMDRIKNEVKDKQEQARLTMELYKQKNINPFSGFLLVFLQLPIIYYLYKAIRTVNSSTAAALASSTLLYSFVHAPAALSTTFLGFVDIAHKSIPLAVIAAIAQYFQAVYGMPQQPAKAPGAPGSFGNDMTKALSLQMKYVFPFLIGWIAYNSGVLALYLITSALFMIAQELLIRRKKKTV